MHRQLHLALALREIELELDHGGLELLLLDLLGVHGVLAPRCGLAFAFGTAALRLDRLDLALHVGHHLLGVVDRFLDLAVERELRRVADQLLAVGGEVVERGLQARKFLHRVEFPALDGVEGFEQRRDVDLDVGAVHLVGEHFEGAAHPQQLVLDLGERRLGAETGFFGFRGELVGVLVAHLVGDKLVDEVLAADLVKLRQQGHELGERQRACGGRPCTERAVGIGRVVVDAVEDLLGDPGAFDAAVELSHQRVGLRPGADPLAHPAHRAVP